MFRRFTFALLIVLCCSLLLASCSKGDDSTNDNNKSNHLQFSGANIAWKEDLTATLTKLKAEGVFDEHFMDGYAVALFDVNFDGVAEIIEAEADGSSGGVNYLAYDLKSGDKLCEFTGGVFHSEHSDAWCVYYNVEDSTFHAIENSTTRGGSANLSRHISELVYDADTSQYIGKSLFYISYAIEEDINDEGNLYEKEVAIEHYCCGENVSVSEYNYQYDLFVASYVRLPETGMKLIRWVDVQDDEDEIQTIANMVDALLNSNQEFVVPNDVCTE